MVNKDLREEEAIDLLINKYGLKKWDILVNDDRYVYSLNMTAKKVTKIEELENFSQLQTLVLSDNQVKKIEGLEKLSKLQTLNLSNNQITKSEGLEALSQLQILDL